MEATKSKTLLNPNRKSEEVLEFEYRLSERIIGQSLAVQQIVGIYQLYLAGMTRPNRPVGNFLFLGPTGSGKTKTVEASAEILFGNADAFLKVDCAEFQYGHEIAKLIGSPPGYLGHRESDPILTQGAIDQYQTDKVKMTFILFDEIEKASDSLWRLLLGILDKGTLTLGDNSKVNLSRCAIFMTSNLGAQEMSKLIDGGIGFNPNLKDQEANVAKLSAKLNETALQAAKRRLSPEFMNRLDKVVVFHTLNRDDLAKILKIELEDVRRQLTYSNPNNIFFFECTDQAKEFLLQKGTDFKYGARHLNRAIEHHLLIPLSNLVTTGQIGFRDKILIDVSETEDTLSFSKNGKLTSSVPSPNKFLAQEKKKPFLQYGGGTIETDSRIVLHGFKVGAHLKLTPAGIPNFCTELKSGSIRIAGFCENDDILVQWGNNLCLRWNQEDFRKFFKLA